MFSIFTNMIINPASGKMYTRMGKDLVSDDGKYFVNVGDTYVSETGRVIQKVGDEWMDTATGKMTPNQDPFDY